MTSARRERTFTFGVVYPFSSHRQLLCQWLSAHGIDPHRDARIVVVPPPQMVTNLAAGHLDGFCVGEPWNSVAVKARTGWCVAVSAELDPGHPEKVLMVRSDFTERRAEEHLALVAALLEACEFCDQPANHEHVAETLARPEYVGVPAEVLQHGLSHFLDFGHGLLRPVEDFCVFHRGGANEPSGEKAAWALELVRGCGLCPDPSALNFAIGRQAFRMDLFEQAARLRGSTKNKPKHESEPEIELVTV